jgi:carbohydrate-binding DOMON domain-containing protein
MQHREMGMELCKEGSYVSMAKSYVAYAQTSWTKTTHTHTHTHTHTCTHTQAHTYTHIVEVSYLTVIELLN